MIKTLCIGAVALYAASKFVDRVYVPSVRRHIKELFVEYPRHDLHTSAILSKLAYEDKIPTELCKQYSLKETLKPISFHENLDHDSQAYIWCDGDDDIYVVFRGTEHERDIIADLDVRTVSVPEWDQSIRVHAGFYRQFISLKNILWKELQEKEKTAKRIIFCGHSLGAAVATIASLAYAKESPNKRVECYTIGSPRVGNYIFAKEFAKQVAQYYRVFNKNDPVSMIPFSARFCHINNGICIDDAGVCYSVPKDEPWYVRPMVSLSDIDVINPIQDHECNTYIDRLQK